MLFPPVGLGGKYDLNLVAEGTALLVGLCDLWS